MKGRLVVSVVLLALIGANAQSEQGAFDPSNREAVLASAQAWARQKNAENNETPMQTALKNAGKIMNAANAQINAQKDDPTATPETVAAGAAYSLTGQEPTQAAVVLSAAKEGLSNAVAGLPQLLQNFQQARQNPLPEQPGPQDLLKGLQTLVGGQDTDIQTVPNKQFYSTRAAAGAGGDAVTSGLSSEQARILTGQAKLIDPGEIHSHDMFPAGEKWVGRAEGSAPPGFNASYMAPAPSADDINALSPSALAKALLYSNPDIVPGSTAFPGKGNADALAQIGAMNDLGTGPAPKSGGGHFEPLQNSFGATLDPSNPGMLSTNRNVLPGSANRGSNVPGGFQSYAQMKSGPATSGLGIPNTLPTTTVLKTELGPDKLPISMSFGRKLLSSS